MATAGIERWRGEGDQSMYTAFIPQDTKLAGSIGNGYSNLEGPLQVQDPSHHDPPASSNAPFDITITDAGYGDGPLINVANDPFEVLCGPLLNYKSLRIVHSGAPTWHGTVLIVTKPSKGHPHLSLKCLGPTRTDQGWKATGYESNSLVEGGSLLSSENQRSIHGTKLYEDPAKAFWRFDLKLPLQEFEARWEYNIPHTRHVSAAGPPNSSAHRFVVPGSSQSMRIMFHSCNGFSVGTDEEAWSGPALWNDVLRIHEKKPFHVMVGGGDQIYNDSVRVDGPLRLWTEIGNPRRRREYPFDAKMRNECDEFYFQNYIQWFSTEPFASANRQIPQINIWDDHDIIDGFGSYTDHFMNCAVFRGIGGVAFKYYLLMQHHIPPPKSTFTTSAPQTTGYKADGTEADPSQLKESFVHKEYNEDSCFIMGGTPGPYIAERSRSLYMQLGARIAFLGVDARTERTRHQVNYPDTYNTIFHRVRSELSKAPEIRHLIVLLGVPIAYPRLAWLENIFTSPIIGPIRFLNKRFGIAGGFFNHFDGQVDLLDDLDDHYTARQHKDERKDLIHRLQALAQEHSVRISILGGDVHLAAVGRFYSRTKLGIPTQQDHRYIANIISSAITNKPPPKAVANLLARRNKIHHLDHDTHETLMNLFDRDPGGSSNKTANFNHCTMPSRNYAIITEADTPTGINGEAVPPPSRDDAVPGGGTAVAAVAKIKDGHSPLHKGEEGAGIEHAAAGGLQSTNGPWSGGLDISIRVEIDQHDREGKTDGYGFSSESKISIFSTWILVANEDDDTVPSLQALTPSSDLKKTVQ